MCGRGEGGGGVTEEGAQPALDRELKTSGESEKKTVKGMGLQMLMAARAWKAGVLEDVLSQTEGQSVSPVVLTASCWVSTCLPSV